MAIDSCSTPLPSQLSRPLKTSLSLLLELKPADPFAFLSAYFLHASRRSELVFEAFAYLSTESKCIDERKNTQSSRAIPISSIGGIHDRIERAFETLLLPSDQTHSHETGVRLKDYFSLSTLFCKGLENLQGSLGRIGSVLIDSEERLSYEIFRDLILMHCLIQGMTFFVVDFCSIINDELWLNRKWETDLLVKMKDQLSVQYPQKTLSKRQLIEWIQDWTVYREKRGTLSTK